jgi:hypothetical protein
VKHIIPETLSCGEGWLMQQKIAHFAKKEDKIIYYFATVWLSAESYMWQRGNQKLKEEIPGYITYAA